MHLAAPLDTLSGLHDLSSPGAKTCLNLSYPDCIWRLRWVPVPHGWPCVTRHNMETPLGTSRFLHDLPSLANRPAITCSTMAHATNSSLFLGFAYSPFKSAIVRPILKKPGSDPELFFNYRPISLLPFRGPLSMKEKPWWSSD